MVYVDTEMEKLNSAKVLRRVHWLCGWEMNQPNDRLNVLWLRDIEDEKDEKGNVRTPAYVIRLRLIRLAIEILAPDCVFIDGIRDIIGDFNNNEESSALVTDLMAIATKMNCCIWNVLHANPRMQQDDESKMRGHLGTELGNKVSDTFVSQKKKDADTGRVTFTVKQQDARGKDVDDWKFEIVDDAGSGLGIPRIMSREQEVQPTAKKVGQDTLKQIYQVMLEAIGKIGSKNYTELFNAIKKQGHVGSTRASEWIKIAIEEKMVEVMNGRYSLNSEISYDEFPF